MKEKWTITIRNPLFWLYDFMFRFHNCSYEKKLYDIPMENNTNFLITQCRCGKTYKIRVHRESQTYMDWLGLNNKRQG